MNELSFPFSLYAFLFFLALCFSAAATPLLMKLARRLGAVDAGGFRKIQVRSTPLLGGLTFALPVLLGMSALAFGADIIFYNWKTVYRLFPENYPDIFAFGSYCRGFEERAFVFLVGAGAIFGLGLVDDLRGMRARYKLLAQLLIAVYVAHSGVVSLQSIQIPLMGPVAINPMMSSLIIVFWIVGLINAMNLIDGIDGLASGVGLIAVFTLTVPVFQQNGVALLVLYSVMAGGLLAFLFFNFHPARIFMGDTGSMFIGYFLAVTSLAASFKAEAATVIFAPILALGVPIFETFASMIRRYIRGVPIFASDGHHTHHRLLRKGYSQGKVALMLYSMALLLSASSLISLHLPSQSVFNFLPVVLAGAAVIWIVWMADYFRSESIQQVVRRRQRNSLLDALARYVRLSLNNSVEEESRNYALDVCRRELHLRFLECWLEEDRHLYAFCRQNPEKGRPRLGDRMDEDTEKIRIKTHEGDNLLIRFAFDHAPDIQEKRDILGCLARIFENLKVFPPGARVIALVEDEAIRQAKEN